MIFCGQCGLQLATGSTRCPRCGATIEEGAAATSGEFHGDDPTVATPSLTSRNPMPTQSQPNQAPLILRPSGAGIPINTNSHPSQGTYNYDATSMMEQQSPPMLGSSYPGYPAQHTNATGYPSSGGNYPTQNPGNYAQQQNMYPDYGTQGAGAYGANPSYPSYANMPPQMGYPNRQQQEDEHAARAARGRTTGLVLVLCGLLFILGAVVLFATQSHFLG